MARIEVSSASGCWLWTGCVDSFGYGKVSVPGGNVDRTHRVMWRAHRGEIPKPLCVLHTCDVPRCCNPAHLFLGTELTNNVDKAEKDRGRRKLTSSDVMAIRAARGAHRVIAKAFGVSRSMVTHIKNRTERKYV
jgi:hypothetical protein